MTRRRDVGGPEHPLLRLQRTAGNQAVTMAIQRDTPWARATKEEKATWFFSRVAMDDPRSLYKGKTDASFDDVKVEKNWEWGLLADDIAIVFQCGRQRFRFETSETGGELFPWGILDRFGDTGGWVTGPLKTALTTIYRHWDDDKRFKAATRVVIDALKADVADYRDLEARYRRRQAAD
jgi:hypothetical protein